jgi:hypothetical protein
LEDSSFASLSTIFLQTKKKKKKRRLYSDTSSKKIDRAKGKGKGGKEGGKLSRSSQRFGRLEG